MEIIMKVKCSPSPGTGSPPHSTLKIVDHHHQLQQHTYTTTNSPHNLLSPPRTYTPNSSTHHHLGGNYPIAPHPTATSPSACNDCTLGYCCNMPQCCITTPSPQYSHTPPQIQPPPSPFLSAEQCSNNACQSAIADEPEFVSIDDEKVKQYLIRLGQQQLQKEKQEQKLQQQKQEQQTKQLSRPAKEPKITRVFSAPISSESTAKPVVYEIIELDDEDEREKLKQIKQQAEQRLVNKKLFSNTIHQMNLATRNTKSLDISLIPKSNEHRIQNSYPEANCKTPKQVSSAATRSTKNDPSNHKIIAEIDLLDSDDDDNDNNDKAFGDDDAYMKDDDQDDAENYECVDDDDDDETFPLAAVSCELQCDDDDDDADDNDNDVLNVARNQALNTNYTSTTLQQDSHSLMRYSKPLVNDVLIVGSKESKNNDDNLLVRWEEYEGQRERVFFECFLCGKKVQSSYNLRRHMMIHTGERPFGCDLCDRRFREFSDLKKHRRRHSNEANYLCMVCHKHKPVEIDPTRCRNCCTQSKNAVIMAAMKPATEADLAAQNRARIKVATEAKLAQTTSAAFKAKSAQATQMPTITSVTSYNKAAKNSQSTSRVTITTAAKAIPTAIKSPETNGSDAPNSPKSNEKTQRLLDNIPAVHRPGNNELGMITRKEFPCPLCNRAFGTRHNLKRHYMIHTGEKPFSCSKCRKPFREFSTLKKHMVTHMRERWYKCSFCNSKFRDFLKYTEHKETHANDNLPELAAKKTFANMQNDNYMMDSNDEDSGPEDWLECCECGQRFNEIEAYNNHLKEHDVNNQVFECYICKEHVKTRTELDKHLRLQHKHEIENDMNNDDDDDYDNDNEEEFIIA